MVWVLFGDIVESTRWACQIIEGSVLQFRFESCSWGNSAKGMNGWRIRDLSLVLLGRSGGTRNYEVAK